MCAQNYREIHPSLEHQMAAEPMGEEKNAKETKRSKENKEPKQKIANQTSTNKNHKGEGQRQALEQVGGKDQQGGPKTLQKTKENRNENEMDDD